MSLSIPTTIVTGFLGSGKTTIISHLIDQLQERGEQVVYIKNEVGTEDIDGQLMAGKHIKTKELLNGCICCTLVGPFHNAIEEVITTYHPDRLIIEASGTADSAALALSVSSHPGLTRDGVVSIIDVVNFEGYQDLSITAQNQTKFTDLLIFNKVELVDLERKQAVVGYVRELNTHSPIIEAPLGRISANLVFGLSSHDLARLLTEYKSEHDQHDAEHERLHQHVAADGLEAVELKFSGNFDQEKLTSTLKNLPQTVFRVKALVKTHSAQNMLCNKVATRIDWQPVSLDLQENVFIFIGHHIAELEPDLRQAIAACQVALV